MAESTPITESTTTPDDETANPLQIERVDEESRASEDTAGSLLEAAQGRPLRLRSARATSTDKFQERRTGSGSSAC